MYLPELRSFLVRAIRSFNGFSPLGVFSDIEEEDYIPEAITIPASDIVEVVDAYFNAIQINQIFSEAEHIWILQNIALNVEILNQFNANNIKTLSMHYLNAVPTRASSRIFCIMLLLMLDKFLHDKQSFVMFIFNQAKETNNERLTQRDTLLDLTDVLIDLGAIKDQAKALRILMILSERSNLKYVTDRVLDLSMNYNEETALILLGWVGRTM